MTRQAWPLRSLLVANAISTAGTSMTLLAVPWFVLVTTHSAGKTGIVGACETVPLVLASAFGGPLVDRVGARRVAVVSDLLSGAGIAMIPLLHRVTHLRLWQICLIIAFVGLMRAPGDTARQVCLPKLVELAQTPMERATSAFDGVSRGARMIGAPAAGALIAAVGPANVMLIDAATFLASGLILRAAVPFARTADVTGDEGYLQQIRGGIRGLRADRLLTAIVSMVLVTNLLDAAWAAVLMPVYAREVLGSAVALGVMFACFGGGALLGTVLYGAVGPRLPRWPVYTVAFLVVGGPRFGVLAFEPPFAVIVATQLLCGIACGSLNPILSAVEFERIPAALQSRVFGAMSAVSWGGTPLGALYGGFAVVTLGIRGAMVTTGLLYTAATLLPLLLPVWRQMDAGRLRPGDQDLELDLHLVADLQRAEQL